jgi:type I restriction enzyme R subunit
LEDLFQPPLSILNAAELGVELFGKKGLKEMILDLNEAAFLRASQINDYRLMIGT